MVSSLSVPPKGSQDLHFNSSHATSPLHQFLLCLWKFNVVYWRCPEYNAVRFLFTIIIGLFIGGIFFGLGTLYSTQQEVSRSSRMKESFAVVTDEGSLTVDQGEILPMSNS